MKKKFIVGIVLVSFIILMIPTIPAVQIETIKKSNYLYLTNESYTIAIKELEKNIKIIDLENKVKYLNKYINKMNLEENDEQYSENGDILKLGRFTGLLWLIAWTIITFFAWGIVLMVGFIGFILELGGLYLLLAVILNILDITPFYFRI